MDVESSVKISIVCFPSSLGSDACTVCAVILTSQTRSAGVLPARARWGRRRPLCGALYATTSSRWSAASSHLPAQRILLRGGAGFIGSHVADALLRGNVELTIVDNLDDFYPTVWKESNLEEVRRAGNYEFHAHDICTQRR